MRCETMHSAAAKGNIPELQVDENAAASTTSPDVAPVDAGVGRGGTVTVRGGIGTSGSSGMACSASSSSG